MIGTVLILDNEVMELEASASCLSKNGFSALPCESPAAAVERLPHQPDGMICLLISDLTLSDGSGVEVILHLVARTPGVKVLVVSELPAETEHFKLFPAGTALFLRKPYSEQDLIGKLVELADKALNGGSESQDAEGERHPREPQREADSPVRQSGLLDLAHDAVIVRSLNGRIRYWNHAAERLYGWPRDHAIGKASHIFLNTVLPQPIENIETSLLESGRWEGELYQTVREGRTVVISSSWAIRNGEDELEVLEINRDISSQKPGEKALIEIDRELQSRIDDLRWAEQKFRALLEPSQMKW